MGKLDVLCYTCLNHIFIRFQYSSQLLKKEQTLRLHTDPATKSLSRAFSCVQHLCYKPDIFCITKLSTLFPHLPLFHIIGASAQSLEELIQTFRSMPSSGQKKEQFDNAGAECRRKYLFLSQRKILGGGTLRIEGAIFFLRILHFASKLLKCHQTMRSSNPACTIIVRALF